jgi:hypothetical protein
VGQFVRQQTEIFSGIIAPAGRQRHIIADGHRIGAVCRRQATGILPARQAHRRRIDADRSAQETPIRFGHHQGGSGDGSRLCSAAHR